MLVGEDILFTVHAYCHAKVISVVADYDCYHLVARPDGSSIMQQPGSRDPRGWLSMIRGPIQLMTEHVPPGAAPRPPAPPATSGSTSSSSSAGRS